MTNKLEKLKKEMNQAEVANDEANEASCIAYKAWQDSKKAYETELNKGKIVTEIVTEINNYADTLDYIQKKECNTYRKHYKGFEYWILRPHYWENRYTDDYFKYFHLCGYVVIPKKSKYYIDNNSLSYNIECHGGLTYAGSRKALDIEFCIGFHCNDLNDASSFNLSLYSSESNKLEREFYEDETYKTVHYVEEECKSIINQLIRNNDK